jgi:hypothetical protein
VLRGQLQAERDREIEMIITRLEEEVAGQHKQLQQQVETRLERQREKYDAQLRDMDALHRAALDKVWCRNGRKPGIKLTFAGHPSCMRRYRRMLVLESV